MRRVIRFYVNFCPLMCAFRITNATTAADASDPTPFNSLNLPINPL
jgi:hypothetical protein